MTAIAHRLEHRLRNVERTARRRRLERLASPEEPDWVFLSDAELEALQAAAERGAPAAVDVLIERGRRRRLLDLDGRCGGPVSRHRLYRGRCRRGDDGACGCVADALDLPAWEALGRAGVLAVARRRCSVPRVRVRRASGAARRRRSRERGRRALAAAVAAAAAEAEAVEVSSAGDSEGVSGAPDEASGDDGGAVVVPLRRPRRARFSSFGSSAAMTDHEAAVLSARLGLPPPATTERSGRW